MSGVGKFWHGLADSLKRAKQRSSWELVLVVALLPALENVMTALVFSVSGPARAAPVVALIAIVLIHAVMGYLVFAGQAACPQGLIADAVELEAKYAEQQEELQRRELTYRLAREAFDKLNRQTCSIANGFFGQEIPHRWCLGGFQQGLEPIVRPFLNVADHTFGVKGVQFTLEAWFETGTVPIVGQNNRPKGGLELHFFIGMHVDHCASVCSDAKCSPCLHCYRTGTAYEHNIDSDKQLFYEGDQVRDDVYFRRYAVCPIEWACTDRQLGVLVLTSMQEEPFADDVLDTMAFLGTLIANYHYAYNECYTEATEPGLRTEPRAMQRQIRATSEDTAIDTAGEPYPAEPASDEE